MGRILVVSHLFFDFFPPVLNSSAKCIQQKIRCTFVKFHRQTAPIGPGHNPIRVPSSVSSQLLSSSFSGASFGGLYGDYAGPYIDGEALMLHPAPAPGSTTSSSSHHRAQQQVDLHRRASFPSFVSNSPGGQPWNNGWHGISSTDASPVSFDAGAGGQFAFNVGGSNGVSFKLYILYLWH